MSGDGKKRTRYGLVAILDQFSSVDQTFSVETGDDLLDELADEAGRPNHVGKDILSFIVCGLLIPPKPVNAQAAHPFNSLTKVPSKASWIKMLD